MEISFGQMGLMFVWDVVSSFDYLDVFVSYNLSLFNLNIVEFQMGFFSICQNNYIDEALWSWWRYNNQQPIIDIAHQLINQPNN